MSTTDETVGVGSMSQRIKHYGINDERIFADINAVYSVWIKERAIPHPGPWQTLDCFIEELNRYIEMGGDGMFKVKAGSDRFVHRTLLSLGNMVHDYMLEGKLTNESAYRIMFVASGDHDRFGAPSYLDYQVDFVNGVFLGPNIKRIN